MDVRRILATIREVDELEIVRQQLAHYQALVEEMKRSVTRPAISAFLEDV